MIFASEREDYHGPAAAATLCTMCGVDPRLVFGRTVLLPHADLSLGPFNGRYNVFDLV